MAFVKTPFANWLLALALALALVTCPSALVTFASLWWSTLAFAFALALLVHKVKRLILIMNFKHLLGLRD